MLRTEMRTKFGHIEFVVVTDEQDFQDVLPGLAYSPGTQGEYSRRFPAANDAERIYANFAQCAAALLAQTARRQPAPWEAALEQLAVTLDGAGVRWFLIGSSALAVRGIPVTPRDIDFVVDDHHRTADALADSLIEPPLFDADRKWIAAWFGRTFLGARVEWVADVYPDLDEWGWPNEIGPTAVSSLEGVSWRGRELIVTPLDVQLAVSERRELKDRVDAIRAYQA